MIPELAPNEPDEQSYGVLKARIGTMLWRHARDAYGEYERNGSLDAILAERATRVWTRLKRLRESGIGYVEAMEMVMRDMFPTEAEPDDDEPWPW